MDDKSLHYEIKGIDLIAKEFNYVNIVIVNSQDL